MALLFDLDAERESRPDPVDAAFELIRDHIGGLEPRSALRRIRRYQSKLSALEMSVVRKVNADTGSDRAAKRMLKDGKTSGAAIAKAAKRGDAAAKNADLIDKVDSGVLSEEQVDVIADTAAKTGGAAATDDSFIDKVASVDPDQARGIANEYVADHADKDKVQSEHDRQRTLRRASKYLAKKNGLDTISIEGDSVAAKNMWAKIRERANELYRADGGRDVSTGLHPRSHDQRLFDAAHELICGVTTTATGCAPKPRNVSAGSGRPQILVGLTLDKYLGLDPAAMAEQIGLGLIPDSVLADYLEHGDIIGVLYDRNGQPLWLGRARRHASLMQRYALIARDKACVLCGADHQVCDVHHVLPWNAPGKGETNLDELVLLCGRCHRQLHADNHTIYKDQRNVWRTRPATANETPPVPSIAFNRPKRE